MSAPSSYRHEGRMTRLNKLKAAILADSGFSFHFSDSQSPQLPDFSASKRPDIDATNLSCFILFQVIRSPDRFKNFFIFRIRGPIKRTDSVIFKLENFWKKYFISRFGRKNCIPILGHQGLWERERETWNGKTCFWEVSILQLNFDHCYWQIRLAMPCHAQASHSDDVRK